MKPLDRSIKLLLEPDERDRSKPPPQSGVLPAEIGKGRPKSKTKRTPYRGLAYAASVPDADGEYGEFFRYPYDGTPGNYGTRQSYLSSAVPTTVIGPGGVHIKQTVARLVARREAGYFDKLRGIPEGSYIQPFIAQPYWVRESDGTTFKDTDEVWTTAGYIVFCNNLAVSTYGLGAGIGLRELVFPFRNKLILLSVGGEVRLLDRPISPKAERGGQTWVEQHGSYYHLDASTDANSVTLINPVPPNYVQPAVNQSGTKFAIYTGDGWAKGYAIAIDSEGVVSAAEEYSVNDGGDSASFSSSTEADERPVPGGHYIEPAVWQVGTFDARWTDGGTNYTAPGYAISEPFQTFDYGDSSAVSLAGTAAAESTVAVAFINDALVPITRRYVITRSGDYHDTAVTVLTQQTFTQQEPPAPETHIPSGFLTFKPGAQTSWFSRYGSGLTLSRQEKVVWPGGELIVFQEERQINIDLNFWYVTGYSNSSIDLDGYQADPDSYVYSYSEDDSFDSVYTRYERTLLLLDPHNSVYAYYEVSTEYAYSGVTRDSPGVGFDSTARTSGTSTIRAKVVVHFGGEVYESNSEPVSAALPSEDVNVLMSDLLQPTLTADSALLRFPVMQGMCPYMAYRRPNTEQAEMVFAHSGAITGAPSGTYFNSAFTAQGVEDWLTSCGVPAAVTTRVATCFRVGGPA